MPVARLKTAAGRRASIVQQQVMMDAVRDRRERLLHEEALARKARASKWGSLRYVPSWSRHPFRENLCPF